MMTLITFLHFVLLLKIIYGKHLTFDYIWGHPFSTCAFMGEGREGFGSHANAYAHYKK